MKVVTITRLFVVALSTLFTTALFAQSTGKAKVNIKKFEEGSSEEYTEEFELMEGQDIQDILRELDLLDEFGQLKEGQAFEINIRKLDGEEEIKSYDLEFYPERNSWFDQKPMLGVMLRDADHEMESQPGAYITEIIDDTGAQAAGLQEGDVIIGIDGKDVNSVEDLVSMIQYKEVEDKVKVNYMRDGKKKKANATLGAWKSEEVFGFGGMDFPFNEFNFEAPTIIEVPEINLEELENMEGDALFWFEEGDWNMEEKSFLGVSPGCGDDGNGVKLGHITNGSSAEDMGLRQGDRVTMFNGVAVDSFDDLADEVDSTKPGDQVELEIERDGKSKKIKGEIGKRKYSNCDSVKIHHDFKGMDEGGNLFYDYQFNMNEEEMENIQREIEDAMRLAETRAQERLMEMEEREADLAERRAEIRENEGEMMIRIEVEEVSDEDAASISGNGQDLSNDNDLVMESISFFPNPSNGIVNLRFSLADHAPVDIMIFDERGNIIFNETRFDFGGTYTNDIDISREADGIYFLQIIQNTKTYSKKLIKQS